MMQASASIAAMSLSAIERFLLFLLKKKSLKGKASVLNQPCRVISYKK